MKLDVKEFLKNSGIDAYFYPGKTVKKFCHQPGEFKSHSVWFQWAESKIRIDVKPGKERELPNKDDLSKYPLSLQSQTFFEIDMLAANDDRDEDIEDTDDSKGSKGSGGKGKSVKTKKEKTSLLSFSAASDKDIQTQGVLSKVVIMGMEVAQQSFESVWNAFKEQVQKGKVLGSDLLTKAGKNITRFNPPAFMQPKGDENADYTYDREKNESMFGMNLG